MSKKIANAVSVCPYDGFYRAVFKHAKTWRVTCTQCGRSWKYKTLPITPTQLNPPPPFQLFS